MAHTIHSGGSRISRGWRQPQGAILFFGIIFAENCTKMKNKVISNRLRLCWRLRLRYL